MKLFLRPLIWLCLLILLTPPGAKFQPEIRNLGSQQAALSAAQAWAGAGGQHTCGLRSNGSLVCWGNDYSGQATPPSGNFTLVSAGLNHTCGLQSDSTVACWGENDHGQASPPTATLFTQVSAGDFHTCGLKNDHSIACWGLNDSGQASPPSGTFTQVSAGGAHTCGLKNDHGIACWGLNDAGQAAPPSGTFTQVSAGSAHTCGLKDDATVVCWGDNTFEQALAPSGTFTQISAGYGHTCGLRNDASAACWGNNDYGQSTPPEGAFVQISVGHQHTCAIRSDGALICWGDNSYGQAPALPVSPGSLPDGLPGSAYSQALGADGGTEPYSYSLASGSLPPGLALNSAGTLSGSFSAAGSYTFTVQVADASFPLGGWQRYTLLVNTPPLASGQSISTAEDTLLPITLNATDADAQLLAWAPGVPEHGTLSGTAPNLTYTPALNYNGPDSFSFSVNDGIIDSNTATVTITVTPVNDNPVAPTIAGVEWLAREAHSFAIPPFSDVDGDTLTYSATISGAPLPAWLAIDPSTGTLNGTPSNAQSGPHTILVSASDGQGGSASAAFTLTVTLNPFMVFLPTIVR